MGMMTNAGMTGMIGVAGLAGTMALAQGCGSDRELQPWPSLGTEMEAGIEAAAGAAGADAAEAEAEAPFDAPLESAVDAPIDTFVPEAGMDVDAAIDAAEDTPHDADAAVGPDAPVTSPYNCLLNVRTFTDPDAGSGALFAMRLRAEANVVPGSSGFVGLMRFDAAPGTDAATEKARYTDEASTWSAAAAALPAWAQHLTGRWRLEVQPSPPPTDKYYLSLTSLDLATQDYANRALFPVTPGLGSGQMAEPSAIAGDNEAYAALEAGLGMFVSCGANCETLHGSVNIAPFTSNAFGQLEIDCAK